MTTQGGARLLTWMSRTFYGELGVSSDADAGAVRDAYRAAMRRHHPDTNRAPDATGRAARINEAWTCLRDPDRRREYDEALRGSAEARVAAVTTRHPYQPAAWRTPSDARPDPLPVAVFVFAAIIAIGPTMALVALAHGWDGSFTHTIHRVAPTMAQTAPPKPRTVRSGGVNTADVRLKSRPLPPAS